MWRQIYIYDHLTQFFLEWRTFQTKSVDKIKAHFMFNNSPHPESDVVYEIRWKNIVELGRLQMTVCRMLNTACARQ